MQTALLGSARARTGAATAAWERPAFVVALTAIAMGALLGCGRRPEEARESSAAALSVDAGASGARAYGPPPSSSIRRRPGGVSPAGGASIWETLCTGAPCTADRPHPRTAAAVGFDERRGVTVVFGGTDAATFGTLGDAWEWNGTAWSAAKSTLSLGRIGSVFVYDAADGALLLFGGTDTGGIDRNDLTLFDGTSWSSVTTTGTPPSGRQVAAVGWDRDRGRLVLFGGMSGGRYFGDTYEWDRSTGAWTAITTAHAPSARVTSLVYDAANRQIVLFGGLDAAGAHGDTWTYDGTDWTDHSAALAVAPPARGRYQMAYDARRARVIIAGGASSGASPSPADTWEWDGATERWSPLGAMPESIRDGAAVFDSVRGRVVLPDGAGDAGALAGVLELHVRGNACAEGCDTASCVDGVCCEASCGACQRCDTAASPGLCAIVSGAESPRCMGSSACDATGVCVAKAALGAPCAGSANCLSGQCADGVCCASACGDPCASCALAGSEGTCTPRPAGATPKASCGGYRCGGGSTSCPSSCTKDADCIDGAYCSATGVCTGRASLGAPCASGDECGSGHCADGVCCDQACDGSCGVCNAAPHVGTCTPVKGAPAAGHPACTGKGVGTPCGPRCDGAGIDGCSFAPATVTACSANACADGTETHASVCDGAGGCNDVSRACGAYRCGASACLTSCASDADCSGANVCTGGVCGPAPKRCSADRSGVIDASGEVKSCAPYLCSAGDCPMLCVTSNDCAAGATCDVTSRACVVDAGSQGGGCATGVGPSSSSSSSSSSTGRSAIVGLAATWLICVRRRRRARGAVKPASA
jgi:hypothetical protein